MLFESFSASLLSVLTLAAGSSAARVRDADKLNLYVSSTNVATNNRALILRPFIYDEAFGRPKGSTHYLGVDDTSPKLTAAMNSGVISSNSTATKGHTAYLNLRQAFQDADETEQYLVFIGNYTTYPGAADTDWTLSTEGDLYSLHHNQPAGTNASFALCEADFNLSFGPWYDLTYVWSNGPLSKMDNCEFVTIKSAAS